MPVIIVYVNISHTVSHISNTIILIKKIQHACIKTVIFEILKLKCVLQLPLVNFCTNASNCNTAIFVKHMHREISIHWHRGIDQRSLYISSEWELEISGTNHNQNENLKAICITSLYWDLVLNVDLRDLRWCWGPTDENVDCTKLPWEYL